MDDAWGADFGFHPKLPPGSMESGADLAIASCHKSLTGLMQTSGILVQGERIDMERLQLALSRGSAGLRGSFGSGRASGREAQFRNLRRARSGGPRRQGGVR